MVNTNRKTRGMAIATFSITGIILLLRWLGVLQVMELSALDLLFRLRPPEPVDRRVVIVGFSEADIQRTNEGTPSDATLVQLLKAIEAQQPRGIGLDIYRDLPVEPGHEELLEVFASVPHLIGIRKVVGDRQDVPVGAPPALAAGDRVGAVEGILDLDGKRRRSFLYIYSQPDDRYIPSFGLRIALLYLEYQNIVPQNANSVGFIGNSDRLGSGLFSR